MKEHIWFFFAFGAAILWGLQYATTEQLLKTVPVPLFTVAYSFSLAASYVVLYAWLRPELQLDRLSSYLTGKNMLFLGIIVSISCVSTLLIFSAIEQGTAAKASLVEIMYPLFVSLFAALLYREAPLTCPMLLGGSLILLGGAIVLRG
jgi:drug/metabolite transporter (DMT)-like permease